MEFKLCCAAVIALVLTLSCNIYAIPLSKLVDADKIPSVTTEPSELDSAENSTVNGTKKDL